MTTGDTAGVASRRSRHRPRARRRVSVTGILGELLITAGVITLLYVGWQLWIGDVIYGAQRNEAGRQLSEEWAAEAGTSPTDDTAGEPAPGTTAPPADPAIAEPVVIAEPAAGEVFGLMRIPRFGSDYQVPIAGGVERDVTLDPIGIGHYPDTGMPGAAGNFALAAHRTTFGAPFNRIADLRLDDAIIVETKAGWYTYRFRSLEYVTPEEIQVLLPVPQVAEAPAGSRYITLTSCSPMLAMTERIVAYGVFESFTPYGAGAPKALTDGATA